MRLIITLVIAALAAGCEMLGSAPASTAATSAPEIVSADVMALAGVMRLDEVPQQVQWVESPLGIASDRVPGPTDRAISAVLTYDSAPQWPAALKLDGGEIVVDSSFVRAWFPDAIKTAFADDPNSDGLLLTVPHYNATPIGLSPYLNGYVFTVDSYVFVYLFTT